MATDAFQRAVDEYRLTVDRALESLIVRHEPAYLYDPVKYVFEGRGKRLRPILVFLVAKMFGTPEVEALPAALAVELLHNFSLVHDDIMDRDNLRHGLPTVYRKWDESAAILAGDAIFALAHGELLKTKRRPLECILVFNRAAVGLCEGQAMDKEFESRRSVTLRQYLNMIRLKRGLSWPPVVDWVPLSRMRRTKRKRPWRISASSWVRHSRSRMISLKSIPVMKRWGKVSAVTS